MQKVDGQSYIRLLNDALSRTQGFRAGMHFVSPYKAGDTIELNIFDGNQSTIIRKSSHIPTPFKDAWDAIDADYIYDPSLD